MSYINYLLLQSSSPKTIGNTTVSTFYLTLGIQKITNPKRTPNYYVQYRASTFSIWAKIAICLFLSILLTNCTTSSKLKPIDTPSFSESNDIIHSKTSTIQIYAGTQAQVVLYAVKPSFDLKFECIQCPTNMKLTRIRNGVSLVSLFAPETKNSAISIQVKSTNLESSYNFGAEILPFTGKKYYFNPKLQDLNSKGTKTSPFPSLSIMLRNGFIPEKNSMLVLMDGKHGKIDFSLDDISLVADINSLPEIEALIIHNSHNLNIYGITVSSTKDYPEEPEYLVYIDSLSSRINLHHNIIQSAGSVIDWTKNDWYNKAKIGILNQGSSVILNSNFISNVFHGIEIENTDCKVDYNLIDRFSGDAIRNIGSNNEFKYNFITNATVSDYADENGNHDDFFQSWTFGNPIRNIILKGNTAISYTQKDLVERTKVIQGLVCFDGFEDGWIISDNLVITDHPHGIALYGATNCTISNNIVLKNPLNLEQFESDPWIMVNNHKDGRKSKNNNVSNNISTAINIPSEDVIQENNLMINSKNDTYFENFKEWNINPKKN